MTRWPLLLRCIRHGHALICTPDGHVCRRCGRFYPNLQRGTTP